MDIVVNFSGGKDSTVMLDVLVKQVGARHNLHAVWADTGWEHAGAREWCESVVNRYGMVLNVVSNPNKDFLSMVERRGMFPGPQYRQCTSDLKRGPVQTWIRRNLGGRRIINAMGLRAAESPARAKQPAWKRNKKLSNSKRVVWDWLPIHEWSDAQIYGYIKQNELPIHPVYGHLPRFSCRVCIFNSPSELAAIERHDPEAIEVIDNLEKRIGFTMFHGQTIRERIDNRTRSDL